MDHNFGSVTTNHCLLKVKSRNKIVELQILPKNKFVHQFFGRICGSTILFRGVLTFRWVPLFSIYKVHMASKWMLNTICKAFDRSMWADLVQNGLNYEVAFKFSVHQRFHKLFFEFSNSLIFTGNKDSSVTSKLL